MKAVNPFFRDGEILGLIDFPPHFLHLARARRPTTPYRLANRFFDIDNWVNKIIGFGFHGDIIRPHRQNSNLTTIDF